MIASHSHVIFLLEELIVHLKTYGSQTYFQQFHDGFDLQRLFRLYVIVMEHISEDLEGFIDWYISEKTKNIKDNEGIWRLKIYRLQQPYEVARFLSEGFRLFSKRTQYFMEETSQYIARGSGGTRCRPQRSIF